MKLLTLDSPSGPTAGAMLESGEVVNFARAAKANSVEAWLPPRLTDILTVSYTHLCREFFVRSVIGFHARVSTNHE